MSWLNQPYQGGYGQQQGYSQGLQPQQTGYVPQQPLQGQRTGFQPQQQFQQPQPTGFMGGGLRPQMPLQGQPTGFAPMQRPMATGFPQQQSFQQQPQFQQPQPTGFGQPTGAFGGVGGGAIQSQFLSTFMPAPNTQPSPYMDPSQMQFATANPGHSLEQSFQQQNQAQTGQAAVPIPWALTADEKKRYDQIFRAWDQQGTGFIEGRVSKEVFGQAGLDQNDLMAIWNLADVADRGKLNIDEFHVAMGLIYRRLNGNPIPHTLPAEMAPPSARDLDDSVGFLTNLLKNDNNQRSTNRDDYDGGRGSMAKARSLHETAPQANRKDATVFRNNDNETPVYKSSSRHLNRDDVRSRSDRDSPSSDLDDVKQRLKNTHSALDRSRDQDEEEEDLKDELRNMTRRIQRVQDDLEYNLRSGRRSSAKDDERRKLERELLNLEHEELPALERRLEDKEREKRRDKQKYALERDTRNDKYDKYRDERDRYSSRGGSGYNSDSRRSPERGYQRGTYDSRDDRDSSRDRSRYSSPPRRGSPPPRSRTPPPPPPPAPKAAAPPPPPPVPAAAPAPAASPAADLKSMTAEERAAHRRAEAQRRVQERLRALGVVAPSSGESPVDTTVADRLEQDRLEAAKRAEAADEEIKNKELERKAKLEKERLKGVAIEQAINESSSAAVEQLREEVHASHPAAPIEQAASAQLDAEEEALAKKEEALKREKAERLARIEKLEQEAREAEENIARSRAMFASKSAKVPPPPPTSRSRPTPPPSRPKAPVSSTDDDDFAPPPPPPPPPPAPSVASPPSLSPPFARSEAATSPGESKNPFHRLQGNAPSPALPLPITSPGVAKPNPFIAAPTPPPAPPAHVAPPAPAPVRQQAPVAKPAYRPPPTDDDWDAGGLEKDADESDSDDEGAIGGGRAAQANLAANLFRGLGLGPPARPSSAQASTPSRSAAASPAPAAPSPPLPPPAAPAAPAAPRAPAAPSAPPAAAPDRSALLGAIQGGLRLKKTTTKDKSGPAVAGAVIGDASPPVQVYQAPSPPPSPPPAPRAPSPPPAPREPSPEPEPVTNGSHYAPLEEESAPVAEEAAPETLPAIADEDPMAAVDLTTTHRMLSVYAYEGQRPEDLTFPESVVILANPAKVESSDWWYGKLESSGEAGWIPKAYIETIKAQSATALFAYTAASEEEHSFEEGDSLTIVDSSDESWWKAEQGGVIRLVPATYVELNTSEASLAPPSVAKPSVRAPVPSPTSLLPAVETADLERSAHESDSSDDDSDAQSPEGARDPKEREIERLRVLEAAGLLVRDGTPSKRRSMRRAAPARPPRQALPALPFTAESEDEEPLPEDEPPIEPEEQQERMEDAFDMYQRAMRELPAINSNRLSVASFDTNTSFSPNPASRLSPPPSPAPSAAPSTASALKDTWHSTASSLRAKMGRNPNSAHGDRARPVVSGPMPTSPVPDDAKASPSFGTSWSSLVDPSALENMPDRERKRQESIFEFITTEQAYVQSLQLIIEVFFTALQPVLAEKASQVVFANIEDILMFNTIFLSELEDRQRTARLYINTIGDVIKTHMKGLDVYRGYCVNQANAARTLADLKASDPSLRAILDGSRVKGLELEHFLLEPMQRLTRYPLLINQILRYTESDHPDTPALTRSLQIAEGTLGGVNEAVRTNENEEKLAMLTDSLEFAGVEGRLDLTAPTRLLGARKILKSGPLAKSKSGRKLNCYLFNDLLLLTESRAGHVESVYRYPMPLEEVAVRDHARDDLAFQIAYRGDSVNVRAASARQCIAWTHEIEQARRTALAALQKRRSSRA